MSNLEPYPFPGTAGVNLELVIPPNTAATDARPIVNNAFDDVRSGILVVAAQQALTNITYLGAGRFVGATIDPDQEPVAGTGLTVRLPNDTYLVEGRVYVVNEADLAPYAVITGITPSKPSGVDVFVGIDDTTGELVTDAAWQFDTFPSSSADLLTISGLLHVGRVTTSASAVTAITPSTIDGRGIIRPRGTGSGGGGGGGITQEDVDAMAAELRADYLARIAAIQGQIVPGVQPKQHSVEYLFHKAQIERSELAQTQETLRVMQELLLTSAQRTAMATRGLITRVRVIERDQSATIVAGAGSGENSGPDFEGEGEGKNTDGTFGGTDTALDIPAGASPVSTDDPRLKSVVVKTLAGNTTATSNDVAARLIVLRGAPGAPPTLTLPNVDFITHIVNEMTIDVNVTRTGGVTTENLLAGDSAGFYHAA